MKGKWVPLLAGVVLGAIVAPLIRSLPVLGKLPTVGR